MKIRKVEKADEAGYPTYLNYLKNHTKELGIIAAGVSLMFNTGCEKTTTTDPTVQPAGVPKPPVKTPANVRGKMVAPTQKKPQTCPSQKLPGVPIPPGEAPAPTPSKTPQVKGKMKAPEHPTKSKGDMPAPRKLGEMPAVKNPDNIMIRAGKPRNPKPPVDKGGKIIPTVNAKEIEDKKALPPDTK